MVTVSLPPDRWTGAGRALRDLWGAARRHHELRLVSGWWRDRATLPPDACAVELRGHQGPRARAKLAWAVAEEVRRFRPDLVVSGTVALPPLRAPLVLVMHDLRLFGGTLADRLRGRAFAQLAGRADAVVTTSLHASSALQALGLPADRLRLVPGAVDLEHFAPDPAARAGAPLEIVCPGRILPAKGQHLVIDAVARLPRQHKAQVQLTIAGSVVDPVYLDQLRVQAWQQPVRFVLDPPLLAPHLRAADMVVLPSIDEAGFSTAALEAMACGAPLIWSDRPAIREVVGGLGQAFRPDDMSGLRAALSRWIDAPAERRAASEAALRFVRGNNGWDVVWPKYDRIFEAVGRGA
jgi:glycosyltransferase involved in cell wall biosynthesis